LAGGDFAQVEGGIDLVGRVDGGVDGGDNGAIVGPDDSGAGFDSNVLGFVAGGSDSHISGARDGSRGFITVHGASWRGGGGLGSRFCGGGGRGSVRGSAFFGDIEIVKTGVDGTTYD